MKRKSKRHEQELSIEDVALEDETNQELEIRKDPTPSITENRILTPPGLQDIRSHMSAQRATTAQTIAELETWRAEIDATIAFLKGDKHRAT